MKKLILGVVAAIAAFAAQAQTPGPDSNSTYWVMEVPTFTCVDGNTSRMTQRQYEARGLGEDKYNIQDFYDGCVLAYGGYGANNGYLPGNTIDVTDQMKGTEEYNRLNTGGKKKK